MRTAPVLLTVVGAVAIITASTSGLAAGLAGICILALATIAAMFAFGVGAGIGSRPRGASQWEVAIRTRREADPTPGWSGSPLDAAPQHYALGYDYQAEYAIAPEPRQARAAIRGATGGARPRPAEAPPAYSYVWAGDRAIGAPDAEPQQRVMRALPAAPRGQVVPRHSRPVVRRRPPGGQQ